MIPKYITWNKELTTWSTRNQIHVEADTWRSTWSRQWQNVNAPPSRDPRIRVTQKTRHIYAWHKRQDTWRSTWTCKKVNACRVVRIRVTKNKPHLFGNIPEDYGRILKMGHFPHTFLAAMLFQEFGVEHIRGQHRCHVDPRELGIFQLSYGGFLRWGYPMVPPNHSFSPDFPL